jgi:hypothetical protein
MTRLGKIARLPREIREELNVRLNNGEVGRLLVEWLNGLPAAQAVLKERFEGRPISEQNLSEWKKGGYEDWLRHQENCAYAAMLTEMAGDLEKEAGKTRLEERLVTPLVMALARMLREAEESTEVAERLKMIVEVGRQLTQIRRGSQQAERVRIAQEQWAEKQSEIAQREHEEAEKAVRTQMIWEQTKAEFPALRGLDELKEELKGMERELGKEKKRSVGEKARPDPGPLPQEREQPAAAAGDSQRDIRVQRSLTLPGGKERELAAAATGETEIAGTQRNTTDGTNRGDMGESNQIKPNQTSCEAPGEVDDGGGGTEGLASGTGGS